MISGFQALRQARAPVKGLEPATERGISAASGKHLLHLESSLQQSYHQLDVVPTDRLAEKLPFQRNYYLKAVSIVHVDSIALSETLRLLTATEIRRADNNYFLHPIIDVCERETHMFMLISDDEVEHIKNGNGGMKALRQLAIKTSTDGY
ncbi:hypothetical protein PoB_002786200 [Plakobranchus ocellatus]|uniref:Uncharacterized protein n=1 Tax=Plakobranchus ocellatus TaxID=259542 RepID=A0AAV4A230_9GAST|nr:hypothetical protein PoB_002786200 [Plakobranchus ocellatus]